MVAVSLPFDVYENIQKLFICRTVEFYNDPLMSFQHEFAMEGTFHLTKTIAMENIIQYIESRPMCTIEVITTCGEEAREVYTGYQNWMAMLYAKQRAALAHVPSGLVVFIVVVINSTALNSAHEYRMKCVYLSNMNGMKVLAVRKKGVEEIDAWFPVPLPQEQQYMTPRTGHSMAHILSQCNQEVIEEPSAPCPRRGEDGSALKEECETFLSATGKLKRICQVQDCPMVAQSRKRCKRHGGGPRCKEEGCTKSSQGQARCRSHGGGKRCQALDCMSAAQQRGVCARHGGVKLCSVEDCPRNARGGGNCQQHGGGKRCHAVGCSSRSRLAGLCTAHKRRLDETGAQHTTRLHGDSSRK